MKSKVVCFSYLTFAKRQDLAKKTAEIAIHKCKKAGKVFRSATVLNTERLLFGLLHKVTADYRYL